MTKPFDSSHSALWDSIPSQRMRTFIDSAGSPQGALDLFVWDRDIASALLADIAVVEVSMRESFHNAASRAWGPRWYETIELDERSESQLSDAWHRLPKDVRKNPGGNDVPGRLIANCTFGFWTNLLDSGGYTGKGPRRKRVEYNAYWTEFKNAFPGGVAEASKQREDPSGIAITAPIFDRAWVYRTCSNVNAIRNRVSHHEPVVNGIPIDGVRDTDNQIVRMTPTEAFEEVLKLARMIDMDLGAWVASASRVPALLHQRPTDATKC